jgi:hypothetical protein
MIESLTSDCVNDFRQRYQRTYGYLLGAQKKKTLCYISKVDDKVHFDTIAGKNFFVYWDVGVEFEFLPITRGWFFTREGWVLLQRTPVKQYNRGISKSNTSCTKDHPYNGLQHLDISLEILYDVFISPPMPTVGKHFHHLFLVTESKVFFYDKQIGVVEGNKIKLTTPLLRQELSDFIRRDGDSYEVTYEY